MNVTMLLADSAQVYEGKLCILGGGWSIVGPDPVPSAVAFKVEVDTHEQGVEHHWELFLEDADGQLVQFDSEDGPQTLEVRGDFMAPEVEGLALGAPVSLPFVVGLGPIPLTPNSRFTWRLVIDGESLPGATASFSTRPLPDFI